MDLGLSKRMMEAVREFVPKASSHLPPHSYDPTCAIDLSSGQNEVVRPELAEFFRKVVEQQFAEKVFDFPAGNGGNVELRNALASFFNSYFRPVHPVRSDNIVLTAGASDAIESVIHAVCDDGDSVIVPGPYWYGFDPLCKFRANVNIIVSQPPSYHNYDNYLLPSLQTVYDFAPKETQSRIKAVLLSNPHNPTSKCYQKQTLIDCMEFCQERGLHLICDEVYGLIRLKEDKRKNRAEFISLLSLTEPLVPEGAVKIDPSRVHVVWSPSKLFGTSGLRVGCLVSQQNSPLLNAVSLLTAGHANNIAALYLTSLLSWSQLPTIIALNSERLTATCNLLSTFLRNHDIDFIPPTDGVFIFAKLSKRSRTEEDETAFYDRLSGRGVMVSQGRRYRGVKGEFGWCRIRFSVKEEVMRSALEILDNFLKKEK